MICNNVPVKSARIISGLIKIKLIKGDNKKTLNKIDIFRVHIL